MAPKTITTHDAKWPFGLPILDALELVLDVADLAGRVAPVTLWQIPNELACTRISGIGHDDGALAYQATGIDMAWTVVGLDGGHRARGWDSALLEMNTHVATI